MKHSMCTFLTVAAVLAASAFALPAFPGAEGWGADTPGGRGLLTGGPGGAPGRVITVTNLNDSGPGSLRAAVEALGPRIVVFRVGGTIRLKSHLRITEPFITIAGQTAPGGGVLLRDAGLYVETHDVVVRFVRVRIGPSTIEEFDTQDPVHIGGGDETYNVVVDHCSFSWSIDECSSAVAPAHDVTFSYCIIGEALRTPFSEEEIGKDRSHSMAMIIGNSPDRVCVHHCLLAHCNSRNPRIQGGTHTFANNVVYDWGFLTGTFSRQPRVNFVGNFYKPGPGSRDMLPIEEDDDAGLIYVKGNISHRRLVDSMPEWGFTVGLPAEVHRMHEPFEMPALSLTSARQAYEDVLAKAGATLPRRDGVDTRLVRDTRWGMGGKIDRPEDAGGFPLIRGGEPAPDSDSDGMPDNWETARGLDPRDAADSYADRDGDGYVNVEEYVNELVAAAAEAEPRVLAYPVPRQYRAEAPYEIACAGSVLPIDAVGHRDPVYFTRLMTDSPQTVLIGLRGGEDLDVRVLPRRHAGQVHVNGCIVRLDIVEPGVREVYITVDGQRLPPLFVLVDPWDDSLVTEDTPGVLVATERGVSPSTDAVQTGAIQTLLDECAASGGGTVYFPQGVYVTGTLRVGSATTVYLAPGAVIRSSDNPDDLPVDPGRAEEGINGRTSSFSRLIIFDNATGAALCGYGALDGRGHVIRNRHGKHVQLVDVTACSDFTMENVMLRNSAEWTLHILGCRGVRCWNVPIINDYGVGNTDGIDVDSSSDVWIERCFAYCGDDTLVCKTTGNSDILAPCENVTFRDCVVTTRKTSLKLGTESNADMRDVVFRDIEVCDSSRGIGIWMRDGATMENCTFRDIRMDLTEIEGESRSGEPYRIAIEEREGIGSVREILFDRVDCASPWRSSITGHAESWIGPLHFWGCRNTVTPRSIKTDSASLFEFTRACDIDFRLMYCDWQQGEGDAWDGYMRLREVQNIDVREFEQVGHTP